MEQNLSFYRIFYQVAKSGNISRAAKSLYISQPAISKAISKLEDSLGISLFIRNSRGVQLTEEGQILFNSVCQAFDALDRGEDELKRIRELGVGHIRIGVSTTLCKYILLPYLQEFIGKHPHVRITILNQSSAQTLDLLEQQQIDIGLIAEPQPRKGILFESVKIIEDGFVAAPSYLSNLKLRGQSGSFDLFRDSIIMMLDKNNITRQFIDDYLRDYHLEPQNMLEVSTMDLLIDFARIGLGVGCVIKDFVQEDLKTGRLVEVPLEIPIPHRTIGFVHSNHSVRAKSAAEFLRFVQNK